MTGAGLPPNSNHHQNHRTQTNAPHAGGAPPPSQSSRNYPLAMPGTNDKNGQAKKVPPPSSTTTRNHHPNLKPPPPYSTSTTTTATLNPMQQAQQNQQLQQQPPKRKRGRPRKDEQRPASQPQRRRTAGAPLKQPPPPPPQQPQQPQPPPHMMRSQYPPSPPILDTLPIMNRMNELYMAQRPSLLLQSMRPADVRVLSLTRVFCFAKRPRQLQELTTPGRQQQQHQTSLVQQYFHLLRKSQNERLLDHINQLCGFRCLACLGAPQYVPGSTGIVMLEQEGITSSKSSSNAASQLKVAEQWLLDMVEKRLEHLVTCPYLNPTIKAELQRPPKRTPSQEAAHKQYLCQIYRHVCHVVHCQQQRSRQLEQQFHAVHLNWNHLARRPQTTTAQAHPDDDTMPLSALRRHPPPPAMPLEVEAMGTEDDLLYHLQRALAGPSPPLLQHHHHRRWISTTDLTDLPGLEWSSSDQCESPWMERWMQCHGLFVDETNSIQIACLECFGRTAAAAAVSSDDSRCCATIDITKEDVVPDLPIPMCNGMPRSMKTFFEMRKVTDRDRAQFLILQRQWRDFAKRCVGLEQETIITSNERRENDPYGSGSVVTSQEDVLDVYRPLPSHLVRKYGPLPMITAPSPEPGTPPDFSGLDDYDVIGGRHSTGFIGNWRFRQFIREHRDEYSSCSEAQQQLMVEQVIEYIKRQGGAFKVQRQGRWIESDPVLTKAYIARSFRRGFPEIYNEKKRWSHNGPGCFVSDLEVGARVGVLHGKIIWPGCDVSDAYPKTVREHIIFSERFGRNAAQDEASYVRYREILEREKPGIFDALRAVNATATSSSQQQEQSSGSALFAGNEGSTSRSEEPTEAAAADPAPAPAQHETEIRPAERQDPPNPAEMVDLTMDSSSDDSGADMSDNEGAVADTKGRVCSADDHTATSDKSNLMNRFRSESADLQDQSINQDHESSVVSNHTSRTSPADIAGGDENDDRADEHSASKSLVEEVFTPE